MQCPECKHNNDGGNFCEQCGTKLDPGGYQGESSKVENLGVKYGQEQVVPRPNQQPNRYLEGAKNTSKMYFSYFLQVLKKPYASSKTIGAEQFKNAIITMVLFAIIIPLIIYFGIKFLASSVNDFDYTFGSNVTVQPQFVDFVIKPFFAYAVFILLVVSFTFISIKLGKINVTYKDVVSRFGAFLIPFVALLVLGLIMSILKMKLFILVLFLGLFTSLCTLPPLVIASFKKENQAGLDVIYGTLLTYILTGITIYIMSNMLFEAIKSAISNMFPTF